LDMAGQSSFTIGKLDAGVAILLGENAHLIEFPSLLLPPGCQPGSIISVSCTRDINAEKKRLADFWKLQSDILSTYGEQSPKPPQLRLRHVTQTSVTLEWDKLDLATARLLGLTIWRNGQRLANIPNPLSNTSTKLSGLDLDAEYVFHLILTTTAGTFASQHIKVRTHKITETSGICVCFGAVEPSSLLEEAKQALEAMNGRWSDKIQIDTTHFVCTSPGAGGQHGPGVQYQRALQLSIPTVLPSWLLACHREKKMVQIAAHYLGSGNAPAVNPSRASRPVPVAAPQPPVATTSQPPPPPTETSNRVVPEPPIESQPVPSSTPPPYEVPSAEPVPIDIDHLMVGKAVEPNSINEIEDRMDDVELDSPDKPSHE